MKRVFHIKSYHYRQFFPFWEIRQWPLFVAVAYVNISGTSLELLGDFFINKTQIHSMSNIACHDHANYMSDAYVQKQNTVAL